MGSGCEGSGGAAGATERRTQGSGGTPAAAHGRVKAPTLPGTRDGKHAQKKGQRQRQRLGAGRGFSRHSQPLILKHTDAQYGFGQCTGGKRP